jgi:hypothetical protein
MSAKRCVMDKVAKFFIIKNVFKCRNSQRVRGRKTGRERGTVTCELRTHPKERFYRKANTRILKYGRKKVGRKEFKNSCGQTSNP